MLQKLINEYNFVVKKLVKTYVELRINLLEKVAINDVLPKAARRNATASTNLKFLGASGNQPLNFDGFIYIRHVRWHRNRSKRLRRVSKNSGTVFSIWRSCVTFVKLQTVPK